MGKDGMAEKAKGWRLKAKGKRFKADKCGILVFRYRYKSFPDIIQSKLDRNTFNSVWFLPL